MSGLLDFTGRTALITGTASGIGAACARFLAERGAAALVLTDIDEAALEALELACDTKRPRRSASSSPAPPPPSPARCWPAMVAIRSRMRE